MIPPPVSFWVAAAFRCHREWVTRPAKSAGLKKKKEQDPNGFCSFFGHLWENGADLGKRVSKSAIFVQNGAHFYWTHRTRDFIIQSRRG
jgi:hypothetical protein